MELSVFTSLIIGPQAVFYDHERDLISAIDSVEICPKSRRIDLPAPVGSLKVWILDAAEDVASGFFDHGRVGRYTAAHVIGEGIEINGPHL